MFRLVAMDRVLVVDKDHVLAGRGAYLHRDARCVEIAVRRGLVPRALRTEGPLDISALQDLQ